MALRMNRLLSLSLTHNVILVTIKIVTKKASSVNKKMKAYPPLTFEFEWHST